jgi:hypothetical protein
MRRTLSYAASLLIGGLAVTIATAGCGQHVSAAPARSAKTAAASPETSSRSVTPGTTKTLTASNGAAPGAENSRAASKPTRPTTAGTHSDGQMLKDGLYIDAPDGTPHYILAIAISKSATFHGSATFLYQDGRTDTVGGFTGKLANGQLTLVFGDGRRLAGTYTAGHFTLTGCSKVLAFATRPEECEFHYNGYIP